MAEATAPSYFNEALLRLLGPTDRQTSSLTHEQWQEIDRIAADQRLQPHLHGRMQRGEIVPQVPGDIARNWSSAYRVNALAGLVQRRDLFSLTRALEGAGIESIALKGAWLAWHAYPAPAERVLRDIDLLVAEADAPSALEVLLAQGLKPIDPLPDDPEAFAAANKQFPPLVGDSGTVAELHAHAWEPPGSMEWPTPPTRDAELLAHTQRNSSDGLGYLAPNDMLAHLAIHAAYSHRFEVGPLLLSDIDYLLRSSQIDWPEFWRKAGTGGYRRGGALTLALVDHWRVPGLLKQAQCPLEVPLAAVSHASALLLQPSAGRHDTRSFAAFEAARTTGGLAKAAAVGFARLGKTVANPAHLIRRMAETAQAASSSRARKTAHSSAMIGQWLSEAG
ncbi:nucleotidyltransferase family protein [Altererythrobacter sp. MF3-039]|uniref:nucleotidyltransferase domain-containing protein n=1 Tax=Altererythrobacter sp. MF3-039 TaxID=3252901 RepID=UPI00390CB07B